MRSIVSVGAWIAQRRKALDMTQRELAARTHCALATIKKIEIDERRPSRQLAAALAGALQIPESVQQDFIACVRGLRALEVLAQIGNDGETVKAADPISSPVISLPAQSTPFIGREQELQQIVTYLDDPACRLLTLVGPGGIGKTRLAYQAAATSGNAFHSGVYAVPLAGISIADYLPSAIAERLKLPLFGSEDPKTQLLNFLRTKQILLVLDNLEHLLDGMGLVAEILAAAPGVKILATSRERLNLSGEWLFQVNGLPFPTTGNHADVEKSTAVQLFEACARRAQPSFRLEDNLTASIRVCELVEGMPLAIELAASWMRRMPCDQIAEQVQQNLDFLAASWRDVPERHRSIRALFEHSWKLLSAEEQDVMMKLSVFRGGFDLEAVQQVANASLAMLTSLEDKSLVQGSPSGRYDLHELIRQYAESRLTEAGQVAELRTRHLDYFMTWMEAAENQLHGPQQVACARRIRSEYNNLRAALGWAFESDNSEKGLRLANALLFYWLLWGGNLDEGLKWTELGLSQTEGITVVRADGYVQGSVLAAQLGNLHQAMEFVQRGSEYSQQLGLKRGIARSIMVMSFIMRDYAEIAAQFESAIAMLRDAGPRWFLARALFLYGDRARVQGDLDRAQALYDEAYLLSQADQDLMAILAQRGRLSRLAALKGDYQKAHQFFQEGIELAQRIDRPPLAMTGFLIPFSGLAIYQGNYESAERYLKEALDWGQEFNNIEAILHATYFLAELALHRQELADAARLLVDSLKMTLNDPEWQHNYTNHEFNTERLFIAGKLACASGDYTVAAWLLSAGEAVREQSRYLLIPLARAEYEQAVQKAREHLGDQAFDIAWREGQTLTEEVALLKTVEYLESTLAKGQHTT